MAETNRSVLMILDTKEENMDRETTPQLAGHCRSWRNTVREGDNAKSNLYESKHAR